MYKNKTILAIIPARGGSKGLPGKNIRELCGKPLVGWSVEAGLQSKYLDEVMVNTDAEEIASIAKRYGANVPFLRSAELATDKALSVDVVKDTLRFYEDDKKRKFDYVVLLEPTSPLREEDDIDKMIEILIDNDTMYDSIISIGEIGEHPSIVKKITDGNLEPFCKDVEQTGRRQDNQAAFFPYGVAYLVKTEAFLEEESFYTQKSTFYKIKRYQCYEIDDIYDFLAIENIMKYERGL